MHKTNTAFSPQANCNLTLTAHETFANFKGAIEMFMVRFNSEQLSAEQWLQWPCKPYFNFIEI